MVSVNGLIKSINQVDATGIIHTVHKSWDAGFDTFVTPYT